MKYLKTFEKLSDEKGRVSDLAEFKIIKTIEELKSEIEKGNKEGALMLATQVENFYKKSAGIA